MVLCKFGHFSTIELSHFWCLSIIVNAYLNESIYLGIVLSSCSMPLEVTGLPRDWCSWPDQVPCLNLARGRTQLMTVQHFIVQSLSLSPFNCLNIGIKHGFSCINIRQGRGFQHLPRNLVNVNALKNHVWLLLLHKNWKHLLYEGCSKWIAYCPLARYPGGAR